MMRKPKPDLERGIVYKVVASEDTQNGSSSAELGESAIYHQPVLYPASLLEEYDALTDKKFEGGLSSHEMQRLQQLKEQMNAIDRASPAVQSSLATVNSTYVNIAALDKEIKDVLKLRRQENAETLIAKSE